MGCRVRWWVASGEWGIGGGEGGASTAAKRGVAKRGGRGNARAVGNPGCYVSPGCVAAGIIRRMVRSVCVYCSSSDEVDPRYFEHARLLGQHMAEAGMGLVFGGGRVGLMGEVARAVHAHGGHVVGVIPESMTNIEIAYHDADELIVTQTMRQRKQIMEDRADAFITLPGGFGTLEELSEMIVGRLLGFHDKPLVLLNSHGFYDPLLRLFDHFIEQRFAKPKHMQSYAVVDSPSAAVQALAKP